jgi:selenide,water dikinase
MPPTLPLSRDLVLIGGGHTHALFLRMWGMTPLPGVRVTLISPEPVAAYSGMLPGHIAGHYPLEALEIDLVRLTRFAGARFVVGAVSGIDRAERRVQVRGHPDIFYDMVSLDIGIHTGMPDLPGFARHATAAKPLDSFAAAWSAWCNGLQQNGAPAEICVLGAGLAGVELALAMTHRITGLGAVPTVAMLDTGEALSGVASGTRQRLLGALQNAGIALHSTVTPVEVTALAVRLADGRSIPSRFTLGVAGARAHGWLDGLGLETHDGYIVVDPQLRSVTDQRIMACGDCAHLGFAPRPKAGVFAVRAAPVLFHNVRAAFSGGRMRPFRPQKDYLKLVSLGGKTALADRSGLTCSSPWLWRWKDRIDRRFMERFTDLPRMASPKLPTPRAEGVSEVLGDKPLCGGCGAKVAGSALKTALARLPAPARNDVLTVPGDDAAILSIGGQRQVMTTDHLRAFTEDPAMLARICAVHALGDIWAMGAQPQAALASITLPRMREEMQAATLREILDVASEVFRAEGADLVGGHTSIGAELTIGFTLTGLAAETPVTLAGAQAGDALLLTKPIGSGTLLAGEMQGKARGKDVMAALRSMARPQGAAAGILAGAHAMTDVTGFGLAGHLMGICDASGTGALLSMADIPVYSGAVDLAADGVRSTIWAANRAVAARMVLPDTPRAALLFDPQTAGGLLAAVAPDQAERLMDELRQTGLAAARIGEITEGPPVISVL